MGIIKTLLFLAVLVAVITSGILGTLYVLGIGLTLAVIGILWKVLYASGIVGATLLILFLLLWFRR